MANFNIEEQEVINNAKHLLKEGLDFPNIVLGLQIRDEKILLQLINDAGNQIFSHYQKDRDQHTLWEKLLNFLYSVFGLEYNKNDVNGKNECGVTPLHMLAGSEVMVKILLELGADLNIRNHSGETPIFGASSLNKLDIVKLMHEKGADLHVENIKGQNIVSALVADHHPDANRDLTEVFKYLLDNNINPHAKDLNNKSALDYAIASGEKSLASLFNEYHVQFQHNKKEMGKHTSAILGEHKNPQIAH